MYETKASCIGFAGQGEMDGYSFLKFSEMIFLKGYDGLLPR